MKGFPIVLFLLMSQFLFAQGLEPVIWSVKYQKVGSDTYEVICEAKIDSGWYIYSMFGDPLEGPIPTSINFEGEGITVLEKGTEKGNKTESYDQFFGIDLVKFSSIATFRQKVKVKPSLSSISGSVEFMTCNDRQCLPPTEVNFDLKL